jgi:hypothetical protein
MNLPVSFEEASYFKSEYRGDLIVTKRVLYYFPHTRTSFARFDNDTLGGREKAEMIGLGQLIVPLAGAAPTLYAVANNSVKFARFLKRFFAPSMNSPRIRKLNLWRRDLSQENFQQILDAYIVETKGQNLEFEEDSVPKPMRFAAGEMENIRVGLKLTFDAKFDNHDFRINLIHRGKLKNALKVGGFIN